MPRLLSANVGLPRDIAWRGEAVRTAILEAAAANLEADAPLLQCFLC